MESKESFKLYEYEIEKYSIRFWSVFKKYLLIYSIILIILVLFNLEKRSLITESCIIIVLLFSLIRFYDVRKWVKIKIEKIELKTETYEIEIVEKNVRNKIKIHAKDLTKKLKWIDNKPKILQLTVFDKGKEIIKIYSGGKSEIEYELEKISFELNKKASH